MGYINFILALCSLVCVALSFILKEVESFFPFVISTITYVIAGLYLTKVTTNMQKPFKKSQTNLLLIWTLSSALASIPFFLAGVISAQPVFDIHINALFESVSGLTSTGLTVISNYEGHLKSILLYRSLLQWIGGIGLAVWMTYFISESSILTKYSKIEIGISPSVGKSIDTKFIVTIYAVGTLLLFSLYLIGGMSIWDSFNLSFSTISTGGFALNSNSFSSYGAFNKCVGIVFMILSSINVYIIANIVKSKKIISILSNKIFLQYLGLIISSILVGFFLGEEISLNRVFNIVSAITTTGLSSENISAYSFYSIALLNTLMFIGAMTASTSGGVKQKNIRFYIIHLLSFIKKTRKNINHSQERREGVLLVYTWFMTVVISVCLIAFLDYGGFSIRLVLFDVVSALTNSGLTLNYITAQSPYSVKLLFIILMIIGRINICSFIYLIISIITKGVSGDES